MAKWFRSEPMEYISLIMNEDAAHDCLGDLGKLGVIQFTDVRFTNTSLAMLVHLRVKNVLKSDATNITRHLRILNRVFGA